MQDLAFFFQTHDLPVCRFPLGIREPGVVPHVQLLHVQRFQAEILERLLGRRGDVLRWKDVAERVAGFAGPLPILRRDLRRHGGLAGTDLVLQLFADQALAVAVPVRQRRIEEGDPLLDRLAHRLAAFAVIDAAPHLAAQAPTSEADLADVVAGVAQSSLLHLTSMWRVPVVSPFDSAVNLIVPGFLPARTMTSALPLNSRTCFAWNDVWLI